MHSPRAICTVLLDPRDPFLQSERTQGFAAGPVYGRAKCLPVLGAFRSVCLCWEHSGLAMMAKPICINPEMSRNVLELLSAIRKEAWLFCESFLLKGEVFTYVGRNQGLKDLKDLKDLDP